LWIAAVDYVKAFDSVEHRSLWDALSEQGVPPGYVELLKKLYSDQKGMVVTDQWSKYFDISRGTKQGDPLSSLLFNSLLEHILRKLKPTWSARRVGIEMSLGTETYLTNLRFADDILLLAHSKKQITDMLQDLQDEAAKHGLQIHPDKTKVIASDKRRATQEITLKDGSVAILGSGEAVKYLGRQLAVTDMHGVEFKHRISRAWASFNVHKDELLNKRYPLKQRLKLFNSTVGASVLYGCETWVLKADQQRRLRAVQRKMLRMILGVKRKALEKDVDIAAVASGRHSVQEMSGNEAEEEFQMESWPDFLRRTARLVEDKLASAGEEEWVTAWRRRQWRWAGSLVRNNKHKWTYAALQWNPLLHTKCSVKRRQARPCKRWEDDLVSFFDGGDWTQKAQQANTWNTLEEAWLTWSKIGHGSGQTRPSS